ncbi:MAG: Fic family protein [Methylococcales bacterium]|nr:Fic family protein [Methylococcales bacterium]
MPSLQLAPVSPIYSGQGKVTACRRATTEGNKARKLGKPCTQMTVSVIVNLPKLSIFVDNPKHIERDGHFVGKTQIGVMRHSLTVCPQFVPPPPNHLMECLDQFEKYLHLEDRPYSSLIDARLVHVQFKTIHPFLDGNGRTGRLLIAFLLIIMGNLKEPVLYLSLYFKNNRYTYYERLTAVRTAVNWEGWLEFFLTGVAETADQVVETGQAVSMLFAEDLVKIETLKRAATPCANMT